MRGLTKSLLGACAIVPLGGPFLIAAYIMFRLISFDMATHAGPSGDPFSAIEQGALDTGDFILIAAAIGAIVVFELILMVVFAMHAVKDPRLTSGAKVVWILALLLFPPIAFPAYFLLYVAREPIPRRVADLERTPIAS